MAKPKQEQLGTITILDEDGSGNITASNAKITNLGTPTASTDAVTKGYVDGYSGWKNANIASDANISVSKLAAGTDNYVLKTVSGVPVWSAGGGGVSDHGDLTGLLDDDHTQYLKADGTRPLSGNIDADGYKITDLGAPVAGTDAATKAYVDGYQYDHGGLVGLADDDHTQYVHNTSDRTISARHTFNPETVNSPFIIGYNATNQLVSGLNADRVDGYNATAFLHANGTISMSGNLDADGYKIIDLGSPVNPTDAVNKSYVDGYSGWTNASIATNANIAVTKLAGGAGNDSTSVLKLSSGIPEWSQLSHSALSGNATGDPHTQYILASGTRAFSGNVSVGTYKITNLGEPADPTDAATKGYIDGYSGWTNASIASNANIAVSKLAAGSDGYVIKTVGGNVVWSAEDASVTDHGALTGLADDDHTQYLRTDGTRVTTGNFTFAQSVVSPIISQSNETNNNTNGDNLTIQAQNATGTTSAGGNLVLQSGTGTSSDGYAYIKTGNADHIIVSTTNTKITGYGTGGGFIFRDQINDSTANTIYPGGVLPTASNHIISTTSGNTSLYINSAGTQRFTISSALKFYIGSEVGSYTNLYFDNQTVNPKLYQLDETTSTSSDSLTIQAQNNTVAGSVGGDLQLQSGTGTTRDGYIRFRAGGYGGTKERILLDGYSVKFDFSEPGSTTRRVVSYLGMSSAYDANMLWLGMTPNTALSDSNYALYSNNTTTRVNGNQNVYFGINGTIRFRVESGSSWIKSDYPNFAFDETLGTPIIYHNPIATTDAVGGTLTIRAQNVPNGSNSVGGDLVLQSGDGNLRDGYVYLKTDGYTRLTIQPDGNISANNGKIINVSNPTDAYDVATKAYVDANGGGSVPIGGANTVYWSNGTSNSFTSSPRFSKAISADGYTFAIEVDGYNSGTFGDGYLGLATNFANSGVLRLPNNESITARNAANDGDIALLKANTSDDLEIGTGVNVFDVTVSGIEFNSNLSSPTIKQTSISDAYATGAPLYISAQSTTGTASTGGDVLISSGTGTTAPGNVDIYTGTANRINITNTAANFNFGGSTGYVSIREAVGATSYGAIYMGLTPAAFTSTNYALRSTGGAAELNATTTINLQTSGTTRFQVTSGAIAVVPQLINWSASVVNPKINQADSAVNSDTGDALTIQAQNCTGTTSTGGNLFLSSGSGTSADGYVGINAGGKNRLNIRTYTADAEYSAIYMGMDGYTPTANNFTLRASQPNHTYLNSGSGGVFIQTAGISRFSVSGSFLTSFLATFRFDKDLSNPLIRQDDATGIGTTGNTFTLQAQNSTGSGSTTGGNLFLKSGTGATDGYVGILAGNDLRLSVTDAYSVFNHTTSTGNVIIRDQVGTTTKGAIYMGLGTTVPASNNYAITSDSTNLTLGASSSIFIAGGYSNRLQIANTIDSYVNTIQWKEAASAPILTQIDKTDANAANMTIQAQNSTASNSTGGNLTLQAGTGTLTDGYVYLKTGSTNKLKVSSILEPQVDVRLPKDKQIQFVNEAGDGYIKALSKDGYNAVVIGDPSNASAIDIRTDGYIDIFNSVLKIGNVSTAPSTDPSSGAYLYTQNGAIKGRGSSGTVTTIAPAHPHCPNCGRDFAFEAENRFGEILSFCFSCLIDEVKRIGGDTNNFIIQRKQR